jgi:hypothetical protein
MAYGDEEEQRNDGARNEWVWMCEIGVGAWVWNGSLFYLLCTVYTIDVSNRIGPLEKSNHLQTTSV